MRHICTIFFYLYFKWIILFFSCIINLSQSDTVMKIRTIFSIFTGPCTNYFLEMRDSGMEKRQRYQGFRKFSIRTRLIIALFLISIVPLTGISFYSFHTLFQKTVLDFHPAGKVLDQGYVDDSEAESAVVFSKNIR